MAPGAGLEPNHPLPTLNAFTCISVRSVCANCQRRFVEPYALRTHDGISGLISCDNSQQYARNTLIYYFRNVREFTEYQQKSQRGPHDGLERRSRLLLTAQQLAVGGNGVSQFCRSYSARVLNAMGSRNEGRFV